MRCYRELDVKVSARGKTEVDRAQATSTMREEVGMRDRVTRWLRERGIGEDYLERSVDRNQVLFDNSMSKQRKLWE